MRINIYSELPVSVAVGVSVGVTVTVIVGVGVKVGVGVAVGTRVGVEVGLGVDVEVAVGVPVGADVGKTLRIEGTSQKAFAFEAGPWLVTLRMNCTCLPARNDRSMTTRLIKPS